jgi:hypothetical protein
MPYKVYPPPSPPIKNMTYFFLQILKIKETGLGQLPWTAIAWYSSLGMPEPTVIMQFHPKERAEKVLSSCSINLPHFSYTFSS